MLTGFILGFVAASGLWWFGVVSAPKIKSWWDAIRSKAST